MTMHIPMPAHANATARTMRAAVSGRFGGPDVLQVTPGAAEPAGQPAQVALAPGRRA
jgi:hypothetical protein